MTGYVSIEAAARAHAERRGWTGPSDLPYVIGVTPGEIREWVDDAFVAGAAWASADLTSRALAWDEGYSHLFNYGRDGREEVASLDDNPYRKPATLATRCPGGDGHAEITGPAQVVNTLTSVSCATCGKHRFEWVTGPAADADDELAETETTATEFGAMWAEAEAANQGSAQTVRARFNDVGGYAEWGISCPIHGLIEADDEADARRSFAAIDRKCPGPHAIVARTVSDWEVRS